MSAFAFSLVKANNAFITGIKSPSYERREQFGIAAQDGTLYQTSAPVIRAAPKATFTTVAIKALFTVLGSGGALPFVALDGTNGCELIGTKINTTGPGYDTAAVHASRKGVAGMIFLSGIRWSPGQIAEAMCDVFWTTAAGGTDPVVPASIALPTIPVNTEQLVLSTCTVPAGALSRIQSLDLSIAHQAENNDDAICFNTGLPFPVLLKQAGIGGAAEVMLTIETLDLTTVMSNGTVTLVFGVLNHNGVGLAAGTATVVINSAVVREDTISGTPAGRRITIRGTWDGTTKPVTTATA